VILSPAYLSSEWAKKELDAFFSKETRQHNSILPILHQLETSDILAFSPNTSERI